MLWHLTFTKTILRPVIRSHHRVCTLTLPAGGGGVGAFGGSSTAAASPDAPAIENNSVSFQRNIKKPNNTNIKPLKSVENECGKRNINVSSNPSTEQSICG